MLNSSESTNTLMSNDLGTSEMTSLKIYSSEK